MDIFHRGLSMDFVLKSNYFLSVFYREIISKKIVSLYFVEKRMTFKA